MTDKGLDTTAKPGARRGDWRSALDANAGLVRLLLITAFIFALMSLLRPNLFFTLTNFSSMAFQFPEFAILSLAMMLAMLTGGIDLSIIGAMNLSAILAALALANWVPDGASPGQVGLVIALAVLIALAVGTLCGLLNGLLIARLGIPPILATLGTSQVYLGLAIVITGGAAVFGFPASFSAIGNGAIGVVPVPLLIFAALAAVVAAVLNKTPFGAKVYMLGTNPVAARFAGLDTTRLIIRTYMLCGLLASVAGIVVASRANSIRADFGSSYLLLTILIAVLGGVNPYGGFGKVSGLVLAVLALQFLSSGFNMLRFSNFSRELIWGALLILVMVLNTVPLRWRRRRDPKKT